LASASLKRRTLFELFVAPRASIKPGQHPSLGSSIQNSITAAGTASDKRQATPKTPP
jgi:hypothetical protein